MHTSVCERLVLYPRPKHARGAKEPVPRRRLRKKTHSPKKNTRNKKMQKSEALMHSTTKHKNTRAQIKRALLCSTVLQGKRKKKTLNERHP